MVARYRPVDAAYVLVISRRHAGRSTEGWYVRILACSGRNCVDSGGLVSATVVLGWGLDGALTAKVWTTWVRRDVKSLR